MPVGDFRIDTFLKFFERYGFAPCDGPVPKTGFEKLAVFGANGEFEHVAVQTIDGRWISKLGELEDISHPLESLAGNQYGQICNYMKREGEINRRDHFPIVAKG